jgi:hypothetical protein
MINGEVYSLDADMGGYIELIIKNKEKKLYDWYYKG